MYSGPLGNYQGIRSHIGSAKIKEWEGVAYYPREVFAYLLSDYLRWNLVPPTVLRTIKGKYPVYRGYYEKPEDLIYEEKESIGALQLFLDYETGRQYQSHNERSAVIKLLSENPELLFKCAVFDFLLQTISRHWDDYLVKQRDEILDIKLIDHGNSMLSTTEQPLEFMRSVFLNLFGRLNLFQSIF